MRASHCGMFGRLVLFASLVCGRDHEWYNTHILGKRFYLSNTHIYGVPPHCMGRSACSVDLRLIARLRSREREGRVSADM